MRNNRRIHNCLCLVILLALTAGLVSCGPKQGAEDRDRRPAGTVNPESTVTPTDGNPGGPDGEVTITPKPTAKPNRRKPEGTIPVVKPTEIPRATEGELKVTWLGHSSSLVQMGPVNILIDPMLYGYAGVAGIGIRRFSEVPLPAENVPEIDVLFLSHDHYDHMNSASIMAIDSKVKCYVVPNGVDDVLKKWGISEDKIFSLEPWGSVNYKGVRMTLTPAQHSCGEQGSPTGLCGGIYVDDGVHTLYYTGDGGYATHFTEIAERLGPVDLMLAESGQYNEAWSKVHMLPEQTVQAAIDVQAKWMIPVHWGAFVLSTHDWDEPPIADTAISAEKGVNIATPRIGQTVDYEDLSNYNERWWETVE